MAARSLYMLLRRSYGADVSNDLYAFRCGGPTNRVSARPRRGDSRTTCSAEAETELDSVDDYFSFARPASMVTTSAVRVEHSSLVEASRFKRRYGSVFDARRLNHHVPMSIVSPSR